MILSSRLLIFFFWVVSQQHQAECIAIDKTDQNPSAAPEQTLVFCFVPVIPHRSPPVADILSPLTTSLLLCPSPSPPLLTS